MDIKITWTNPNLVYDEIDVFRSEAPIDKQNLPAPIATLTTVGVNEFIDTGLTQGKKYYYALRIRYGTDFIVSDILPAQTNHYTGPLGQKLLFGDMDLGYFGFFPANDFLNLDQLKNIFDPIMPVSASRGTWVPAGPQYWHKFAYRGKILITPANFLRHTITWDALYQAGLVYGNEVPTWETGGIPQGFKTTVGQDVFTVRLFKGFDSCVTPTFTSANQGSSAYFVYETSLNKPQGEWFDIMNSVCLRNDGRLYFTDVSNSFNYATVNYFALLQDSYGAENATDKLLMGNSYSGAGAVNGIQTARFSFFPLAGLTIPKNLTAQTVSLVPRRTGWRPVFELEV